MASCDQSNEMAVPERESSSHGPSSAAQTSGYTSYFSVNGTDPDPNADVAGLGGCSVLNALPPASPGHRQSAVALHQSSEGSPKNGEDNRLVMHTYVALLKQYQRATGDCSNSLRSQLKSRERNLLHTSQPVSGTALSHRQFERFRRNLDLSFSFITVAVRDVCDHHEKRIFR
ncbi:hypothetical protein GHT06_011441 [Daphnia sinensis]|uniref:Uncharacterized protein n=1 Tax=Daphnia sinensis TaxID=1820382 RepID=A0AAD5LMH0_9CRUS|nr:hypothetical protein GHT06_011441 [Daphnia sinensis]